MNTISWRATVNSSAFSLAELCIVVISGAVLSLVPSVGIWAIVVSLIPSAFRFSVGEPLFRRTRVDPLLAIFLLTACVGIWAAYDESTALHKFFTIVVGIILYYVVSSQPKKNIVWVAALFFSAGIIASAYFFLTHDFVAFPRKIELVNTIGQWIMWVRPEVGWRAIHPNYIAGIAAITAFFGCYLLLRGEFPAHYSHVVKRFITLGLFLLLSAIVMSTSRGVFMGLVAVAGVLLLWMVAKLISSAFRLRNVSFFPLVVLVFLSAVVVLVYLGPARTGSSISESDNYGTSSRAEVFMRSMYLAADFPIIGAGLGSFPGLYSQYMLGIPNYYLPNSHNLFLDVFIELGIFGGLAFLMLYLASIWYISQNIASGQGYGGTLLHWVALSALVVAFVHGMVDDYLFQGSGAFLSVALLGVVPDPSGVTPIYQAARHPSGKDIILMAVAGAAMLALILIYQNAIRSVWFSNLGAVQMAKVELAGFPTNQWAEADIVEKLQDAETSFLASVEADPSNRTANHRLGLISMLRRDFVSGCAYLEGAREQSPGHRGIIKSLGYCYVWLGEYGKARLYLAQILESRGELDVYIWWWGTQGRNDLSENASLALDMLGYSK